MYFFEMPLNYKYRAEATQKLLDSALFKFYDIIWCTFILLSMRMVWNVEFSVSK